MREACSAPIIISRWGMQYATRLLMCECVPPQHEAPPIHTAAANLACGDAT
jgi:hypothetical protein